MDDETTSPPRPIAGTIGSRVRVILGDTGNEWILLMNHDNGSAQWQTTNWSGFSNDAVTTQVLNCEKKGRYVKEIAVGSSGAWFVNGIKRNGTGGHSWWGSTSADYEIGESIKSSHGTKVSFGTDEMGSETYVLVHGSNGYTSSSNVSSSLTSRMYRIRKKKGTIDFIRLFDDDAYFIRDSDGTQWLGLSSYVEKEIKKSYVEDVAIAKDGSWVVIRGDNFVCSRGVDDDLKKNLTTFFRLQKQRNTERSNEIREYHDQVRRRREAREAAEAAAEQERQRLAREAAEEEERQRLARERQQQEQIRKQKRASELVSELVRESDARIQQEMESIKEMEDILLKRKRSIKSMISDMPAKRRAIIMQAVGDVDAHDESKARRVSCVVCHDEAAVMAIVPCGHHCLCEECSMTIVECPLSYRLCPLCRSQIQSTLRIYSTF
mmetsp:Transcript_15538/g.29305  ORF Transcript_15538/g.29305 Transcript_15538/m.29305 type:complete len:436 (+) Transcript_15538:387-1694(+)